MIKDILVKLPPWPSDHASAYAISLGAAFAAHVTALPSSALRGPTST
jgi:hypothetical protein